MTIEQSTNVPAVPTRRRRTQEERSQDMQTRILGAAVAIISRQGLQKTSTHDIAREARVSRGALLHHYPTRAALLGAAFSHLLEDETARIEDFSDTLSRDGSSIATLIGFIRERYSGPLFLVTLDYLSLARVDQETREAILPGSQQYVQKLDELWDKCLADISAPHDLKRMLMNQTMLMIRGISFQGVWRDDDPFFDALMSGWITQVQRRLGLDGGPCKAGDA